MESRTGRNESRTALITGGSSGLGLAIAKRFVREGYRVAIVARGPERLARAAVELGAEVRGIAADLSDRSQVENALGDVAAQLGRIDVLVNAAGFTRSVNADMPLALAEQQWDEVIEANLKGTFLTTLAVLPHMSDSDASGRIVNISSIAAQTGSSRPGGLAYAAAKGGVQGFTLSLARELGPRGITVNAIAPGFIRDTAFFGEAPPEDRILQVAAETPMARVGVPDDVAGAVAWLASRETSFVTGTVISVNGGWRIG